MPYTQREIKFPARKYGNRSAEARATKGSSCITKAVLDENDWRQRRRASKRLFDSWKSSDDASENSEIHEGEEAVGLSASPMKTKSNPVWAPTGSLCLEKQDTSPYQKAKQCLTSESVSRIVGREKETQAISAFLQHHLRSNSSASMYISGAPGTGKTACLTHVLEAAKNTRVFQSVFVNCMLLRNSAAIYGKILDGLGFSSGADGPLHSIRRHLTSKGHPVVIVVDEIDQLDSKNETVLYSLFELPKLEKSRAIFFGIANAMDLTDRTLPHLQAYGCKPQLLNFPPYSRDEIVAILRDRLQECAAVIQPQAIQFCARKIAACTGDVRKALDICRRAIEVVERNVRSQQILAPRLEYGYNPGSPKKVPLKIVDMTHISTVLADVFGSQATGSRDLHATLPLQQKLLLCALVVLLRSNKLRDVPVGKLQEVYVHICEKHQCLSDQSDFQSLGTLLESRGLISIKKHRERRLCKVSLRIDEEEVEHVLQDKALLAACLQESTRP